MQGRSNPGSVVTLTVRVRPRNPQSQLQKTVHELAAKLPTHRQYLTRAEYANLHGADPADLEKVKAFASKHGLAVTSVSIPRRAVRLIGSVTAVEQAFGVQLQDYQHGKTLYRGNDQHAQVPAELGPIVESIVGFDTRPYARPHFRLALASRGYAAAHLAPTSFNPNQLAAIYDFPDADGTGQTIGIIELSAPDGSGFRTSDLDTYFQGLGLPTPDIVAVSVDGAINDPGTDPSDPQNADGEVMLDIEVAGAIAPKAKFVVYFAPNTAQGFMDVIDHTVHDSDHNPRVISLSWGSAENPGGPNDIQINQILQAAAALGVTFCVASGDSSSRDDPSNPDQATVDFPASSPYALGCGGTKLEVSGTKIVEEVVWEDHSGGGVSRIFGLPEYQKTAGVPPAVNPPGPVGRGVPDVAGDADPQTGYNILVDGQTTVIGGTSAVAPLWAGLIARLNQKLGHSVGFVNPLLYQNPDAFNDIVSGSNIDYSAGPGWDPCTGLGSPRGMAILQALTPKTT
ncbi:MAG: S53 family peptidase [Isosphaeraceae bacterium]